MPEVPAQLANFIEPHFARPARVQDVCELSSRLRKVSFQGQALRDLPFRPGHEIEFRVSERAFRHYTPLYADPERGIVEVVFYLHGKGPGSGWASELRPGDQVNLLGPGGRFGLQKRDTHVFLGDETTLGLFGCLEMAAPRLCLGAIEIQEGACAWPDMVGLSIDAVERRGNHGAALEDWLLSADLQPSPAYGFYLAGHAATIARLRRLLISRGWARRQIRTKAYWADGKRGL